MNTHVMETTRAPRAAMSTLPSRKPQIPFALRTIKWMFPKVERIAPRLASRWFIKLFFSPPKFPFPKQEKAVINEAQRFNIKINNHTVQCYRWGSGPVVLLVHGWAGRAGQFRTFIPFLTNAGYQVIAFDAPAHGLTEGSKTTVIDFKDSILELSNIVGPFHAIVAHSLGGGASLFAMSEGLKVKTLVTIATPTIGEEIVHEFNARLNGSGKSIPALHAHIESTLQRPFHEFMSTHFIPKIEHRFAWLIIHDENDREASTTNARRLKEAYPDAALWETNGLGHVRILKDEKVIERCLAHLLGH